MAAYRSRRLAAGSIGLPNLSFTSDYFDQEINLAIGELLSARHSHYNDTHDI